MYNFTFTDVHRHFLHYFHAWGGFQYHTTYVYKGPTRSVSEAERVKEDAYLGSKGVEIKIEMLTTQPRGDLCPSWQSHIFKTLGLNTFY